MTEEIVHLSRVVSHFGFYCRNYRSESFDRYLPRFLGPVVNE